VLEVILGFGRVNLVGEDIFFEKNFYRLTFTPPLWSPIIVLQYVRLDILCLAYQISLVPKTVSFDPEPKNDGNRLVGAFLCGAFFLVFVFAL
jgi:hypothetical protein